VAEILVWNRVLSDGEMKSVTSYLRYGVLGFSRPGPVPKNIPSDNLYAWFPSATADKDAWMSAVPGGRPFVASPVFGTTVGVRTDEPGQDGAVGAVKCVYGDDRSRYLFSDDLLPNTFTLCSSVALHVEGKTVPRAHSQWRSW